MSLLNFCSLMVFIIYWIYRANSAKEWAVITVMIFLMLINFITLFYYDWYSKH